MVPVLPHSVCEMLVDGDAAGLEGLGGDLLLLVADQVGNKWEEVHGGLLGAHVIDLDLGLGDAAAVPRLDVRLVLLVPVAAERTAARGRSLRF